MAADSSVHSNALNFMSAMQSGVDPRTRLYKMAINLPQVMSNELRGPGFTPALSYSALSTMDKGFGLGWDLQLTEYSLRNQVLALSTGETFKVTGSDSQTGQLVMKEKKLDSFHFYQLSPTLYRVVHKSGVVEILEEQGSAQNLVALCVAIYSPQGHKLTLGHVPFTGAQWMLSWIKDDSDNTLLSIKRNTSTVEVQFYPFAGADGTPVARFVMELETSDKRVSRIVLPDDQASWRIEYLLKDDQVCIKSVDTPTGGHEDISYGDLGHQYPVGSGRKALPRVTGHRINPGAGQPVIEVAYSSPDEHNFLGGGLRILWSDDGLDNLYRYLGVYEYKCIETLRVEGKAVRSIEHTFNQFHLMTQKKTTQNNNVQTVKTTFFLTPGASFEQQPRYFQLPQEVKTTWSQLDDVTRQRSETVRSTYDVHGNLLTQTQANGVVETRTWHAAADSDDFVRYIRDLTVTPAASPEGGAPTLRTHYTYKSMAPLTGTPLADWRTLDTETLVQVEASSETELQKTAYTHFDEPGEPFLHGRVKRQTVILNGKSSFVDYGYEKFVSPEMQMPVLQTTDTVSTDFDNVSNVITRQHSLLTSQEVLNRVGTAENRFFYDSLGRLTGETTAKGTAYEAHRRYESTLSAVAGQLVEHIIINAKNIRQRTVLDGLGRAIFEERDHVDTANPDVPRQTSATVFNEWGDVAEQTVHDWLDGTPLALTTRFEYDDWGQQCAAIGPDGVVEYQINDPIGTPQSAGPITRSWRQSTANPPSISGMSETWLNLFGKPTLTRVLGAAGQELAVETFKYDGAGRCTEKTDANKRITRFTYDAWSRMSTSTLPDNTIVKHEYAPHSTSELAVTLSIGDGLKDTLVGEREFDGLERLIRLTTGQRTERYTYEGGEPQVSSKVTPANQTIRYDYNLTLTDQPIASHAPDESVGFSFDNVSARLTQAKNEQGTREYEYNVSNQVIAERWTDNQDTTWHTLHSSSMQGRLLKRTDLKQGASQGLDTVHHYDAVGRLARTEQGRLEALFEYDDLGQLYRTTTRDLAANSELQTEMKYDDQGQEILRTQTLDQQPPRTQEQIWRPDGLLESRHLKQGAASLLEEHFGYDFRGRLTHHQCSGATLPHNDEGRAYTQQIFDFNAFDSITTTRTTFADGSNELARFTYAVDDPCLLEKVTYTPTRATGDPVFKYDLNGNQLNDERGRPLFYDSQDRLLRVETAEGEVISQYRYDGHDHLVTSQHGTQAETLRFYQGEQLNAVVQDDRQTRLLYHDDQPLGQQEAGDDAQTLLLMTDANNSVLGESQQKVVRTAVYSAYGERHSDDALRSLTAFNGEVLDSSTRWYLLGRGYRAYNPVLMRFHSRDSQSPFDGGGINPYSYCLGNPIALRDPTGHEAIGWSGRLRRPDEDSVAGLSGGGGNVMGWVFVAIGAVGTVAAAVATVLTAGGAAPLFGKMFVLTVAKATALATTTALSAASTAASAVAAANGNEEAGQWGMYLGVASTVTWIGAAGFGKLLERGLDAGLAKMLRNGLGPTNKMFGADRQLLSVFGSSHKMTIPRAKLSPPSASRGFHSPAARGQLVPASVTLPRSNIPTASRRASPPAFTDEIPGASSNLKKTKAPPPAPPKPETDAIKVAVTSFATNKDPGLAARDADGLESQILQSHMVRQ